MVLPMVPGAKLFCIFVERSKRRGRSARREKRGKNLVRCKKKRPTLLTRREKIKSCSDLLAGSKERGTRGENRILKGR